MSCDPCAVGVVFDGPWDRNRELRASFEPEIVSLAAPRFTVSFPAGARRVADWTLPGAREEVEALLADSAVDIVLTVGPLSSAHAILREESRGELPKPVIATFVIDPEAQGFPIEANDAGERTSGRANLSYLTFTRDAAEEIRRLREVVPFDHPAFLVQESLLAATPALEETLPRAIAAIGGNSDILRVGASAKDALAALPAAVDAVYLTPLPQLPAHEFDRLVAGLAERRLPSFSFSGRSEVDRGVLASLYLDADLKRLGRRIALHVQRILAGEDAGALPVDFRRSVRLTLNLRTARAIGVHPDWRTMSEAELLHAGPTEQTRRLSLVSTVREALAANPDVAAASRAVAAGSQTVRAARAALRPQLRASTGAEAIDRDRAESSFGLRPAFTAAGSLGLSQTLYSDGARARVDIERHRQMTREEARREQRLDVAHGAAVAYLNVLRAKTFERIRRENLALTRSHLDVARTRRRLGVARATEVARWENQIANDRRAVIDAESERRIAGIALNRLLHRSLEEPLATADVDLHDPGLKASAALAEDYVNNPFAFAILRDFMSAEALAGSPELGRLDAAVAAQERAATAARRALWRPVVTAAGDLSVVETEDGSFDLDSLALPFPITRPNALNWSIGVSASLPLFSGGALRAERSRAEEELEELRLTRDATAARIEQRLRTALHRAGASFAGIGLAQDAAAAAERNLTLVTDAYEQGALSILDLIDAQNAALVAEQDAATAVYAYLIDLMDAHRASGRLDAFTGEATGLGSDFTARLQTYFREAGYEPRQER